jgi:hypothetical protein
VNSLSRASGFIVVAIVVISQPLNPSAQRAGFRSGVDVVSMNVTVTDAQRRYVTDLDRADFQVREVRAAPSGAADRRSRLFRNRGEGTQRGIW